MDQKPIAVGELRKYRGKLLREEVCGRDTPVLLGKVGEPNESLRLLKWIKHGIDETRAVELLTTRNYP